MAESQAVLNLSDAHLKITHDNLFCYCLNNSGTLLPRCNGRKVLQTAFDLRLSVDDLTNNESAMRSLVVTVSPTMGGSALNKRVKLFLRRLNSERLLQVLRSYLPSDAIHISAQIKSALPVPMETNEQLIRPVEIPPSITAGIQSTSTSDQHSTSIITKQRASNIADVQSQCVSDIISSPRRSERLKNEVKLQTTSPSDKSTSGSSKRKSRRERSSERKMMESASKKTRRQLFGTTEDMHIHSCAVQSTSTQQIAPVVTSTVQNLTSQEFDTLHKCGFCLCEDSEVERSHNCLANSLLVWMKAENKTHSNMGGPRQWRYLIQSHISPEQRELYNITADQEDVQSTESEEQDVEDRLYRICEGISDVLDMNRLVEQIVKKYTTKSTQRPLASSLPSSLRTVPQPNISTVESDAVYNDEELADLLILFENIDEDEDTLDTHSEPELVLTSKQRGKLTKKERAEAKRLERNARDRARRRRTAANVALDDRTFPVAACDEDSYNDILPFDVGLMDKECEFCLARNFELERKTAGHFSICCQNGKVRLPDLHPTDDIIRNYLTEDNAASKNLRTHIRHYNSAMATVSWRSDLRNPVQQRPVPNVGPYVFRVQGGFYHYKSTLYPPEGKDRSFGQLYILDADEATEARMSHHSNEDKFGNKRCQYNTLKALHEYIMRVNPYAKGLHTMHELIENEEALALAEGRTPIQVRLVITSSGGHPGRYNLPTVPDIAALFEGTHDGQPAAERQLIFYARGGGLTQISSKDPNCDPMCYPLLFPHGEFGWKPDMPHVPERATRVRNKITVREFYCYRLANREGFSAIHRSGKLFQQYVVNAGVNDESNKLDFIKHNQDILRADTFKGLQDYLERQAEDQNARVGKMVILPSTFQGSPRAMAQNYQDSMAIASKCGNPTFLITMTCSPFWKEIQAALDESEEVANRPDIIARVFKMKLDEFLKDICTSQVFGEVAGYVYVVEYQKRGLPHCHTALILKDKIEDVSVIDKYVCAEIPDKDKHPILYELVKKYMIHGPCGPGYRKRSPCMVDGICSKKFPKPYCESTMSDVNGYPVYRRRRNGNTITMKFNGVPKEIDNSYVVPYNPYLLLKYACHVNTEFCASIKSLIYLFKYIHKGHDCASVVLRADGNRRPANTDTIPMEVGQETVEDPTRVQPAVPCHDEPCLDESDVPLEGLIGATPDRVPTLEWDEIQVYLNTRYLSSCESSWRLFGFQMHGHSHVIYRLAVHLPDEQYIIWKAGMELNAYVDSEHRLTTLTAWFKLNEENPGSQYNVGTGPNEEYLIARQYTYLEIPHHYRFTKGSLNMEWIPRKRESSGEQIIPRMYFVNPKDSERFHLRMLLLYVKGPTTFEDVRTYDGIVYETFKEACFARGLLEDDKQWYLTMRDAAKFKLPRELRNLFVIILYYNQPTDALALWEEFKADLSMDFDFQNRQEYAESMCLSLLQRQLVYHNSDLSDFKLPYPNALLLDEPRRPVGDDLLDICNEMERGYSEMNLLNSDQRKIADHVFDLIKDKTPRAKCLFIDGPAGTGKTTTYNAIYHKARGQGLKVICVAFSGIAALQLPGGRTAHSQFKIPIYFDENSTSNHVSSSMQARLIHEANMIIWDEAAMSHRHAISVVNRFLQFMDGNSTVPFAGKVFLLGGDFRQTLPVVQNGSASQMIEASIKRSSLWPHFKTMSLTKNMRAAQDPEFEQFLLGVGNGTLHIEGMGEYAMKLPSQCIVPCDKSLITEIFGDQIIVPSDNSNGDYYHKVILCPTNYDSFILNERVMLIVPGPAMEFLSVDTATGGDLMAVSNYPPEFLHAQTPSGLPRHHLVLKKGTVIMLLTNLNPPEGLCNGTRLVIMNMTEHVLDCKNITAGFVGKRVFIPKIKLSSCDKLPFDLQRFQLPIRIAFVITMNKSQGQTMDRVGVYLNKPVFSHGQLYVALSRARTFQSLKIQVFDHRGQGRVETECDHNPPEGSECQLDHTDYYYTQNVVYQEILQL